MTDTPMIIVFGEDDNDREAIKLLIQALWPSAPRIEKRAHPILLMKSKDEARQRMLTTAVQVIRAEQAKTGSRSIRVVNHEDADNVEPAHEALAIRCEKHFSDQGMPCIGAVPAWEIEAWWYLWPTAVLAVNPRWKDPARHGKEVGRIKHAKERLIADLRPKLKRGERGPNDYRESDSPKIAAKVRDLGLVDARVAKSQSFDRFAARIRGWACGNPEGGDPSNAETAGRRRRQRRAT